MMDGETGTLVTERWAARWDRGTAVTSSIQGSVGLVFPNQSDKDQRSTLERTCYAGAEERWIPRAQKEGEGKKGLSNGVTGCPSLEKDRMMDGV